MIMAASCFWVNDMSFLFVVPFVFNIEILPVGSC